MYRSSGTYYAQGRRTPDFGAEYKCGDTITVRLDLREVDASTVAFRNNGKDVGSAQTIHRQQHGGDVDDASSYHFAFEALCEGNAVTIVKVEYVE